MRMATLISSALLTTCFAALASPAPAEGVRSTKSAAFPAQFRGDWYYEPGPCDRSPDRLALNVGPTLLNYFDEFEGRLRSIVHQSRRAVRYKAEYSAEGRSWHVEETLRLSEKGNEMTLKPERTAPRYFRCSTSFR
jgi:hypothetical protein